MAGPAGVLTTLGGFRGTTCRMNRLDLAHIRTLREGAVHRDNVRNQRDDKEVFWGRGRRSRRNGGKLRRVGYVGLIIDLILKIDRQDHRRARRIRGRENYVWICCCRHTASGGTAPRLVVVTDVES